MKEYIEMAAVQKLVLATALAYGGEPDQYTLFLDKLDKIPAAVVVEVVRCRDCKHITVGNIIRGQIYPACRKYKIMVGEDFFCADGERRETTHD